MFPGDVRPGGLALGRQQFADVVERGHVARQAAARVFGRQAEQQRLQQFLDRLLHELTLWWSTLLTWSQAQVLWQYYHLEPPDKQASEDVLPADEAGCQQLLASALKRLRSASSKRQLERLIVKAARGT